MRVTKQIRREAKELFRACIVKSRLDENRVREIVRKVAETKPRGYIQILWQLERLVKLELDRRTARVESATALSTELQADVKRRLSALYGEGLDISFVSNPALLGGLRIRIGSDVFDGSIQARLHALAESF